MLYGPANGLLAETPMALEKKDVRSAIVADSVPMSMQPNGLTELFRSAVPYWVREWRGGGVPVGTVTARAVLKSPVMIMCLSNSPLA